MRDYPLGMPYQLELDDTYGWLREHEPLARIQLPYGEPAWLATRYDDVRTVFADPRFSRAAAVGRDAPRMYPEPVPGGLSDLDPPEHTRMRRLIGQAFTARRVELLRPRAEEIVEDLLDRLAAQGPPADLVEGYAVPLPATMICELLGVPYEDRATFRSWADAYMTTTAIPLEEKTARLAALGGYLARLVARRRESPTDDLIGALVRARDERDSLSEEELIGFLMTLLAAGYETTASQIANFTYALLTHPDQLALLREGQVDLADAVEELLRYVPVTATAATFIPRYATEDVALEGGTVRANEPVFAAYYAANRDPRVFEDPERLDLTRKPQPNFAFGHGPHFCPGAALARMELQVALAALLRRLPGLRPAVAGEELSWKSGMVIRGPVSLPVTW
ncbi:cytochrome P450 [Nonomuraea sp. NPDC049158]|uniref:cytochrome P450 n=1 Tax=Nonomuraea sp. NPDC049158 TaxID=3155649 RepID=UPI0033FB478E